MRQTMLINALALLLAAPGAQAADCILANGASASLVLGQANFTSNAVNQGGAAGANTMQTPYSFHYDGTYFWVNDSNNSRVLRFTGIPSSSNASADLVLGQADFSSVLVNRGGTPAADTLGHNHGVFSTGSKLIVADSDNSRVLIWNSLPTANGQPADVVLGQSSFSSGAINQTGNTLVATAQSMFYPTDVEVVGGRLFVVDKDNQRVLAYNSIPTVSNAAADYVLFQADLTSNQPNRNLGVPAANSIHHPHGIASDGTRLAVADYFNNRVLLFNSIPTATGASADVVIGQTAFNTATVGAATMAELYRPRDVAFNGGQLVITDYGWNRVLLYNSIPSANGASADILIGQSATGTGGYDMGLGSVNAGGFRDPSRAAVINGKLWVADWSNSRVLAFDCAAPTPTPTRTPTFTPTRTPVADPCAITTGSSADFAVGQPDLSSAVANNGGVSASSDYGAEKFWTDGNKLIVADALNHRIRIYNSMPGAFGAPADVIVGQPTVSSNSPGVSRMFHPLGVWYDGTRLMVADSENHRVLIWNSLPTVTGQAPDLVLGQADLSSNSANRGGSTAANTVNWPKDVWSDGTRLLVVDERNSRVLIWNSFPTVNGQAADLVIGQPNLSSGATGTSASTMNWPQGMFVHAGKLLVADTLNHRVLVFNSIPSANGAAADLVIGQSTFTGNFGATSATGLYTPVHVAVKSNGAVAVADMYNHRVLIWHSFPTANGTAADAVLGQADFTSGTANRGGSVGPNTINRSTGLAWLGDDLWVADHFNYRILRFTSACATATPTRTPSPTPTATSSSSTATPTRTPSVTFSPSATATPTSSPTATSTPTVTPAGPLPSATATATATPAGPTATPTAQPTKVRRDDDRVDCHPNFVRGRGQVMKILARSYSGGQCGLKVNRPNGRVLADLWHGYMAPQEIRRQDWDTKDSQGAETPSGVYYVVFTDGDGSIQVQKVLIVR